MNIFAWLPGKRITRIRQLNDETHPARQKLKDSSFSRVVIRFICVHIEDKPKAI